MSRWLLLVPLALVACGGESRQTVVQVSIPDPDSVETPAAGVAVVALPYDRDSLRHAFEVAAVAEHGPRPSTAALDSLYARFRGPFVAFASATQRANQLRDSSAPAAEVAAAERERERARAALDTARADLATRGDSLRNIQVQWDNSTFQKWDSVTRALVRESGRQPVTDTTDATGHARLRLPSGDWWITAQAWDALDPNSRWYWNVPANRAGAGDTLRLDARNRLRRPRY